MIKRVYAKIILHSIKKYQRGLYSISECFAAIDHDIQSLTSDIQDINTRISEQNRLYKYTFNKLLNVIKHNERIYTNE